MTRVATAAAIRASCERTRWDDNGARLAPPTVHMLAGAILASIPDAEPTSLDTRGEGVLLTFEVGGAAYRLQLDPLNRRQTDKEES